MRSEMPLVDLPRFLHGGGRWLTCQEILDGALAETAGHLAAALGGQAPAARVGTGAH